jgi:hypothetical protein
VLILGSGNIVHDLGEVVWADTVWGPRGHPGCGRQGGSEAALHQPGSYWSSGTICYEPFGPPLIGPTLRWLEWGSLAITCARSASVISEAKARTIHPALFKRLDRS